MLIKNNKGIYILSALSNFENLVHGFSTVEFGNMKVGKEGEKRKVEGNRKSFFKKLGIGETSVVTAEQIHGGKIALVSKKNSEEKIAGVDGLVTSDKGLFLMVFVADCLPILAFDPGRQIIGIAHAGWRGTVAKVAENLIRTFVKMGSQPNQIIVGFGPAIEFCHYEVGEDRASEIIGAGLESALLKSVSGKTFFDLKAANLKQLMSVGILKSNIDMSLKVCTYENFDFYSWRREKPNLSGNFAAVIGLPAGRQG